MWKKIKEKLNKIYNYLFEDYAPCNKDIIKTLENIETLDDVWIEKDGEIKRGWIWEINKKAILVAMYDYPEIIKIHYQRPLNVSIIKDKDIIMYLNHESKI